MSPFPKLSDIGIAKKDSSRWKSIAEIPQEVFEEEIRKAKDANQLGRLRDGGGGTATNTE